MDLQSILVECLGQPLKHSSDYLHFEFNCPVCDEGRNKHNFNVDIERKIYHCWACNDSGTIKKLIRKYGSSTMMTQYITWTSQLNPARPKRIDNISTKTPEPLSLSGSLDLCSNKLSNHGIIALQYLYSRCITNEQIKKWQMKYFDSGEYKFRIVIPSYSKEGKLEYFVTRAFYDDVTPKYKTCVGPKKEDIIFGEKFICWQYPVILVEGIFDALVLPNAVPILGSEIKVCKKLLKKLADNHSSVILAFDSDKAGQKVTRSALKLLTSLRLDVKIATIDKGKDISEVYCKEGKEGIVRILRNTKYYSDLDLLSLTI